MIRRERAQGKRNQIHSLHSFAATSKSWFFPLNSFMKTLTHFKLTLLLAVLVAVSAQGQLFSYMGFGENDTRTLLVINPDGSCVWTNETTQARKAMEMQLSTWERYSAMSDNADSEDEDAAAAPPRPSKPEKKSLTNEELASKLRQMYQQQAGSEEGEAIKLAAMDISSNSVRLVTSRSFASLKELLSQNPYTWGPNVLMFEDARLEVDTNHNLRLTFNSSRFAARYGETMSRRWKSARMNFEWKLVLPGRILSSGLPHTQDTATWLSLDSKKPNTLDAALKLIGPPLVITAEPAGIKLDEPLESKKLVRAAWKQRQPEADIPITDATPGFLAEPVGLTLSTVHCFPEGEKYFRDRPQGSMFGLSSTGVVISAKLFPPRGRVIKSVSGARVKAAKDDQGRPVPGISPGDDEEQSYREYTFSSSGDSENGGAARIELRLGLPAPDAKAIDELQAEAVALTFGSWKEMTLTNVQVDAQKSIDLGEVLPGAKLIIKKISGKKPQKTIEATLEGPKEVSQIEVKVKLSSRRGGQSSMNERQSKTSGNKTTRHITIHAYEFEMGGPAESGPLTLLVRYPQDVRRERVRFKLTALDLL